MFGFFGIFRGVFDVKVEDIMLSMKLVVVEVIVLVVSDDELGEDYIIFFLFYFDVFLKEVRVVVEVVMKEGVVGRKVSGEWVEEYMRRFREFYLVFIELLNEKRKIFSGRGSFF